MAKRAWDSHAIKAEVHRQGWTLAQIAQANKLSPSAVRMCLRLQPGYPAEQAIARAIDVPAHELWPERYEPDGTPRHPRYRNRDSSRTQKRGHRQKGAAA